MIGQSALWDFEHQAGRRAQLPFPMWLGVKLGVLLFGNGLRHRVNGALYPRKIIAGILVNGAGL
jgi:hypothetical protein